MMKDCQAVRALQTPSLQSESQQACAQCSGCWLGRPRPCPDISNVFPGLEGAV